VVSGLALVAPNLLLSTGHDGTLRLWDLNTMKQLLAEGGSSRRNPITCLHWCAARQEAAICTQGSKAYIWAFKRLQQPRMLLVLDHSAKGQPKAASEIDETAEDSKSNGGCTGASADVIPAKLSNMRWLTQSDLAGLPSAADAGQEQQLGGGAGPKWPDLVAEAIRDASYDIPEVTQVGFLGGGLGGMGGSAVGLF